MYIFSLICTKTTAEFFELIKSPWIMHQDYFFNYNQHKKGNLQSGSILAAFKLIIVLLHGYFGCPVESTVLKKMVIDTFTND